MATKHQSIFMEDSDSSQSINTTTTAASEFGSDDEFEVEQILAEMPGEDGIVYYLIEWQGYPLGRASWEPTEQVVHEATLQDWEEKKCTAQRPGGKPLFDVDRWHEAVERDQAEKKRKRGVRRERRRGRGEVVRESDADESEDGKDELPTMEAPTPTRAVPLSPVKQKGVAQVVTRPRKRSNVVVDDDDDDDDEGSEDGSLFGGSLGQFASPRPDASSSGPALTPRKTSQAGDSGAALRQPKKKSITTKPPTGPAPAAPQEKPSGTSAARKSAPSGPVATIKATEHKSIFASDWTTEQKTRRSRQRVSDKARKDSTEPKFRNLQTQNRFRKYSKNEPAPNPDDLVMVDPKTGRVQPPKGPPASAIPSAYGRRTPPRNARPRSQSRSRSPPALEPRRTSTTSAGLPTTLGSSTNTQPVSTDTVDGRKSITCKRWQQGVCELTADTCPYAHHDVREGVEAAGDVQREPTKRETTCYFWNNYGWCKNESSGRCEFAHWDTGIYAGPPGSFKSRMTGGNAPLHGPEPEPSYVRPNNASALTNDYEKLRPKSQVTCFFWKANGSCKNEVSGQCEFSHVDTGVYAPPPSGYRPKVMEANVQQEALERVQSLLHQRLAVEGDAGGITNETSPPALVQPPDPAQGSSLPHLSPSEPMDIDSAPVKASDPMLGNRQRSLASSALAQSSTQNDAPSSVDGAGERKEADRPPSPAEDPRLRRKLSLTTYTPIASPSHHTAKGSAIDGGGKTMATESPINATAPPLNPVEQQLKEEFDMAKHAIANLDLVPLLSSKDKPPIEYVFIQMPPGRSQEMKLLAKKLESFKCKVYNSREPGHWDFFQRSFKAQCLIIVHPCESFYGTIPGLHDSLMATTVSVFSVGVQHELCMREGREPAYEAQRMFAMAGLTFITDDVFVYYPEKATQIIEDFVKMAKVKPLGGEYSKIGARPGVKDWLLMLAQRRWEEEKCEEKYKDMRWLKCYDALCELCPIEDEDPESLPWRSVPLDRSLLWSTNEDYLPSFKGRWESGDEEGATEFMVEYFAGEACMSAWRYRRFQVIYQRPGQERVVENSQGVKQVEQDVDPKRWKAKYSHVGVMTADKYLQGKK